MAKIDKKEYDLSNKAERNEYWKLYAQKNLIGKVVKAYNVRVALLTSIKGNFEQGCKTHD